MDPFIRTVYLVVGLLVILTCGYLVMQPAPAKAGVYRGSAITHVDRANSGKVQ